MTDSIESLKQKEKELSERLQAIYDDYKRGLDADSEERATQLENAETLNEIERVTAEELEKVRARLNELMN